MFDQLKNKTILITGGTGFFGKVLSDYFLRINQDHNLKLKLILMARNAPDVTGAQFFAADIREKISLSEKVDYIIHAATPVVNSSVDNNQLLEVIINGTQNILEFAKESGARKIINISSGAVYGEQPENLEMVAEDYIQKVPVYNSSSSYGFGKRVAEKLVETFCIANNLPYVTLRCFAFSGRFLPLNAHFALGNFVQDAIQNGVINIKGDGTAIRSYLDSEELAEWIVKIMLSDITNDTFNLGSDRAISISELANLVASLVSGSTVNIEHKPNPALKKNRYVPNINKIKNAFGIEQKINLEESIMKMIKHSR